MSPDSSSKVIASRHALVLSPTPTYPLDAGNRKRIYQLCHTFQSIGVTITFLHYPAEHNWRGSIPFEDNRTMQSQWEAYFVCPVTRGLHENARVTDHAIDEWWDPAIGDMLRWLFNNRSFDVFIVNYAWLSKAFEFCPPHVLKILDTHDRLSGRREILAEKGIGPEFFHVTTEEEAIALNRADVVWSIKPTEAAFFRQLTSRIVINMPFIEVFNKTFNNKTASKVIRFGIIGAANNINRVNIEYFLDVAEEYIRRTLLPCEFWIAGSCCDILRNRGLSYVRYLGRVDDTAEFYASVDVVLAPITFSTGLKIKVGEALCAGKALIAHEHAFEGYHDLHDFHRLPTIEAMLGACRAIVSAPHLIDELEKLSIRSANLSRNEYLESIDQTFLSYWKVKRGICIIVSSIDLFPGSIVLDHVIECAHYLFHLGKIVILVDGGLDWLDDDDICERLQDAGLLLSSCFPQQPHAQRMSERGVIYRAASDVLGDGHFAYWFTTKPMGLFPVSPCRQGVAYVAFDAFACSQQCISAAEFGREIGSHFNQVVIVRRRQEEIADDDAGGFQKNYYFASMLWRGQNSRCVDIIQKNNRNVLTILTDDISDPIIELCTNIIRNNCSNSIEIVVSGKSSIALSGLLAHSLQLGVSIEVMHFTDYFRAREIKRTSPWFVLDLSLSPVFDALREVFERAHVPVAELFVPGSRPAHGYWVSNSFRSGLFESVSWLQTLLRDPYAMRMLAVARDQTGNYNSDPGWCRVWQDISQLTDSAA